VDGILDWARAQPATAATRAEILHRLAALMAGSRRRQLGGSDTERCTAALATAISLLEA
jgi:hypothetical protein